MLLSICIPNYNKPALLRNCLESIYQSKLKSTMDFEICISDNSSTQKIDDVVKDYNNKLKINFNINKINIGVGANILKSVSMAKGKFVWIIGNDDIVLPHTISRLYKLLTLDEKIEFFFINSFEVHSSIILDEDMKFNLKNLKGNLKRRSLLSESKRLKFLDLIDPEVSWDFLLGLYLSVFKREKWVKNADVVNNEKMNMPGTFSSFENTCPHIQIFAAAFTNSNAYFEKDPLIISTIGERDWKSLYNFIEIIRIPEILDLFRDKGLSLKKYLIYKNFSLRNYASYLIKMIIFRGDTGLKYFKIKKHLFNNLIFPNIYLSIFKPFFNFSHKLIRRKKNG